MSLEASKGQAAHPLGVLADGALASIVSQAALHMQVPPQHPHHNGNGTQTHRHRDHSYDLTLAQETTAHLPCVLLCCVLTGV